MTMKILADLKHSKAKRYRRKNIEKHANRWLTNSVYDRE